MESINVNLDSWIIQDGNYEDFIVGQEATFALEFYPHSELKRSKPGERAFVSAGPSEYQVVAEVIYRSPKAVVVDFGLMVYRETENFEYAERDWFDGKLNIGIDPFFYSSYLKDEPGIPWIKYKFRIDEILLDTTPWIQDGRMQYRDESRISFRSVSKTNAWEDDDGNGSYILKCSGIQQTMRPEKGKFRGP